MGYFFKDLKILVLFNTIGVCLLNCIVQVMEGKNEGKCDELAFLQYSIASYKQFIDYCLEVSIEVFCLLQLLHHEDVVGMHVLGTITHICLFLLTHSYILYLRACEMHKI